MPTTTTSGIVKPAAGTEPADLYGTTTRLADSVESVFGAVAWTAVTFAGAWVNFGGSEQTVQYRKVGDLVQIRGVAKSGAAGTVFTLPVGYRPPATHYEVGFSGSTGAVTFNVASTGVVSVNGYLGTGSNASAVLTTEFSVTA